MNLQVKSERVKLNQKEKNNYHILTHIYWPPHAKSWLIGKDSDAGRDWGQEEKRTTEDEMAGWHHWLDARGSEWTLGVGDGQGGLACCDSWGRKVLDTTEQLNWTGVKQEWLCNNLVFCLSFPGGTELNSPILVHFSLLIPKMSIFTLAISCLTTSTLPWFHGPNIAGSYAILLFIASDFTSITSHIHNWVLFLLWLHLFILSGVISPLISSSIFGTYRPGEFLFQCPIFLPFHTVHGVLKARILKWFAIPFTSGPRFVRTLHHDPSILGGPT